MRSLRCLILVLGGILFLALPSFALDFADYYPTAQGSSWAYLESGSHGGESYGPITRTFFIDGFENVDYSGTIYSGYKFFSEPGYYSVERMSVASLEMFKSVYPFGYSLNQPALAVPRVFNLGDTIEITYKNYNYNNSGVLQSIEDHNSRFTFAGLEDVTVSAGTFADSLKMIDEESWGIDGNITGAGNGITYFAPGVGIVKDYWSEINSYEADPYISNQELTGYSVTPEPVSCVLFLLGAGALGYGRLLKRGKKV